MYIVKYGLINIGVYLISPCHYSFLANVLTQYNFVHLMTEISVSLFAPNTTVIVQQSGATNSIILHYIK